MNNLSKSMEKKVYHIVDLHYEILYMIKLRILSNGNWLNLNSLVNPKGKKVNIHWFDHRMSSRSFAFLSMLNNICTLLDIKHHIPIARNRSFSSSFVFSHHNNGDELQPIIRSHTWIHSLFLYVCRYMLSNITLLSRRLQCWCCR